jgi:hypothetical protein
MICLNNTTILIHDEILLFVGRRLILHKTILAIEVEGLGILILVTATTIDIFMAVKGIDTQLGILLESHELLQGSYEIALAIELKDYHTGSGAIHGSRELHTHTLVSATRT